MLEVGTGFHPELSGRDNIFLNGAILGMNKQEIRSKFDEIVDFAGVERYIDTPVKRYSSGMYVRLAFAVAAHLEPEILIVDEVLAVGDAEFQKKALGKMKDVSGREGRTVLFVSHNMQAILNLCSKAILLNKGKVVYNGLVQDVVRKYNEENQSKSTKKIIVDKKEKKAKITFFELVERTTGNDVISTFMDVQFKIGIECKEPIQRLIIGLGINDVNDHRIFTLLNSSVHQPFNAEIGYNEYICNVELITLKPGFYSTEISIATKFEQLDYYSNNLMFEIHNPNIMNIQFPTQSQGSIFLKQEWIKETR